MTGHSVQIWPYPSSNCGGLPKWICLQQEPTENSISSVPCGGLSPGLLTDAFFLSWKNSLLYAFSPVLLLPGVIFKIKQDHAHLVLIAPVWLCQHWSLAILTLLVEALLSVPLDPDIISWDHRCQLHPNLQALYLNNMDASSLWKVLLEGCSKCATEQWKTLS